MKTLLALVAIVTMVSGCAPRSFDALPDGTLAVASDGKLVTFATDGQSSRQVWSIEMDSQINWLRWSPQRTHIAFIAHIEDRLEPKGKVELRVIDADGKNLRRLAQLGQTLPQPPVWSPDGSRMAFIDEQRLESSESNCRVQIVQLNGGESQQIESSLPISCVRFSPDGKRLLLARGGSDKDRITLGEILIVELESGAERCVAAVFFALNQVEWLDDHNIIFSAPQISLPLAVKPGQSMDEELVQSMSIFRFDLQTMQTTVIQPQASIYFSLSPDRKRVMYQKRLKSALDFTASVWCSNVDGSQAAEVSRDNGEFFPFWVGSAQIAVEKTRARTKDEEAKEGFSVGGKAFPRGPGREPDSIQILDLNGRLVRDLKYSDIPR